MADEIELKLELFAADAERVIASNLFADGKVVQQVSTYFDTGDHALAKAGFSLRIRQTGDIRVQTIKANGTSTAGLFMRTEWERLVEEDAPVLDHATPLPAILGAAADDIAPLFEVRVERHKWVVDEDGSIIEVVLDRGEIVAGDRADPVCEIELELTLGDPAALFGFARKIDAVVPVRLGVGTKSDRGHVLIEALRTCVRSAPVALEAGIDAAGAFKAVVQACIRQYRTNETLLLDRRDPLALHQARVAIRRMRSAFSIFKPMIDDEGAGQCEELRWLASELGKCRDLDVLLDRSPSGPLRDRIAAARTTAYDSLLEILNTHRARIIMLNITHWLMQGRWTGSENREVHGDQSARTFARTVLARFRRRIKRRGEGLASATDEVRHEIRKDAKKLRYASEFFSSLFLRKRERRRHERFVATLEDLQDRLGAFNDLAAAHDVLATIGLAEEADARRLLPAASARKKMLQRAEHAYDELFDTKRFW